MTIRGSGGGRPRVVWVGIGLLFAVVVGYSHGREGALQYLTGFLIPVATPPEKDRLLRAPDGAADFDPAEVHAAKGPYHLVVIARDVNDMRSLARLAQDLLHDVVVRLRPVPLTAQLPAVDDVADEEERVAARRTVQDFSDGIAQDAGLVPLDEFDGFGDDGVAQFLVFEPRRLAAFHVTDAADAIDDCAGVLLVRALLEQIGSLQAGRLVAQVREVAHLDRRGGAGEDPGALALGVALEVDGDVDLLGFGIVLPLMPMAVRGHDLRGYDVSGTLYPRLSLEAAKGLLLPLDHSSLWFRVAAGTALAAG